MRFKTTQPKQFAIKLIIFWGRVNRTNADCPLLDRTAHDLSLDEIWPFFRFLSRFKPLHLERKTDTFSMFGISPEM